MEPVTVNETGFLRVRSPPWWNLYRRWQRWRLLRVLRRLDSKYEFYSFEDKAEEGT
jgi:hypothetical protein